MKARDIMTRDATCVAATDTLEEAARRLRDAGVGAMPICGEDDRLAGMLTDRDIVVRAIARGKDVARTVVGELAQGAPVTIGADDSIRRTLRTMERAKVRRLPVIDGHRLVGIVSQADVARNLSRRRAGELLRDVSKPDRGRGRRLLRLLVIAAPVVGVLAARRLRARATTGAEPLRIRQSLIVSAPVRATYDRWTQFEDFPAFMAGVEEVRQLDETHLHWRARVAGRAREWDAVVTEREPDRVVAWRATGDLRNDGVVRFAPLGDDRTRVELELALAPSDPIDRAGVALGLAERRVKGDLERFRELVEARGGQVEG